MHTPPAIQLSPEKSPAQKPDPKRYPHPWPGNDELDHVGKADTAYHAKHVPIGLVKNDDKDHHVTNQRKFRSSNFRLY